MKWFKQIKESLGRKETAEAPVSACGKDAPRLSLVPPMDTEKKPAEFLTKAGSDAARVASLTRREREVFDWLLAGKKQREIADLMQVQLTTVSFHCTALYKKLDIHDKAHLFLRYAGFRSARER